MGMLVSPYRHASSALTDMALVYRTTGSATTGAQPFTTEMTDRGGFWASGNPTKMIMPSSALVRTAASLYTTQPGTFSTQKNAATFDGAGVFNSNYASGDDGACGHSAIVSALLNDEFTLTSDTSAYETASGAEHWFGIEVIDPAMRYAVARRSASTQAMALNTPVKVVFDQEIIDASGLYDPSTGTITLPQNSGGKAWRVTCGVETASAANGASVWITDAATVASGTVRGQGASAEGNFTGNKFLCATTAPLEVGSGGLTLSVYVISGAATSLRNVPNCWVCIEEVPAYTRCLAYMTTTQATNLVSAVQVPMGAAVYGGTMLSGGGIQVPSGATEGRFSFGFDHPDGSAQPLMWIAKNDAVRRAGIPFDSCGGFYAVASGLGLFRPVTPGDVWSLYAFGRSTTGTLGDSVRMWLAAEFR